MNAGRAIMLAVDIMIESPLWQAQPDSAAVIRRALDVASAELSTDAAELAIVLTDDSSMRALNRQWRDIDKPTNVLSFPAPRSANGASPALGDIVIAYETSLKEADREEMPFSHHLAHLAVHGFLHLMGYDHEGDGEATVMEDLERSILAQIGVPDPYAVSGAGR
jgi:probable rRNA maturation factor